MRRIDIGVFVSAIELHSTRLRLFRDRADRSSSVKPAKIDDFILFIGLREVCRSVLTKRKRNAAVRPSMVLAELALAKQIRLVATDMLRAKALGRTMEVLGIVLH